MYMFVISTSSHRRELTEGTEVGVCHSSTGTPSQKEEAPSGFRMPATSLCPLPPGSLGKFRLPWLTAVPPGVSGIIIIIIIIISAFLSLCGGAVGHVTRSFPAN